MIRATKNISIFSARLLIYELITFLIINFIDKVNGYYKSNQYFIDFWVLLSINVCILISSLSTCNLGYTIVETLNLKKKNFKLIILLWNTLMYILPLSLFAINIEKSPVYLYCTVVILLHQILDGVLLYLPNKKVNIATFIFTFLFFASVNIVLYFK